MTTVFGFVKSTQWHLLGILDSEIGGALSIEVDSLGWKSTVDAGAMILDCCEASDLFRYGAIGTMSDRLVLTVTGPGKLFLPMSAKKPANGRSPSLTVSILRRASEI